MILLKEYQKDIPIVFVTDFDSLAKNTFQNVQRLINEPL